VCKCDWSHIVTPRVAGVSVGGWDLNWEKISLPRAGLKCDLNRPRLTLEGSRSGAF